MPVSTIIIGGGSTASTQNVLHTKDTWEKQQGATWYWNIILEFQSTVKFRVIYLELKNLKHRAILAKLCCNDSLVIEDVIAKLMQFLSEHASNERQHFHCGSVSHLEERLLYSVPLRLTNQATAAKSVFQFLRNFVSLSCVFVCLLNDAEPTEL
jgi:hypothetical protein